MPSNHIQEFEIESGSASYSFFVDHFHRNRLLLAASTHDAIELLLQEAEANRRLGNLAPAARLFSIALSQSTQSEFTCGAAWAQWGLGMLHRSISRYKLARQYFLRAYATARLANDLRCMLWSRAELAETDRITGNYREALHAHHALQMDFRSLGDARGVSWATSGIAQMLRIVGEWESAAVEFSIAADTAQQLSDGVSSGWALRGLAEVAREQHHYNIAINFGQSAIENFIRQGYTLGTAYAEKTLADTLIQCGQLDDAASLARSALAHFHATHEVRGIGFSYLTLASLGLAAGDPASAIRYAQLSCALLNRTAASVPLRFDPSVLLSHLKNAHPRLFRTIVTSTHSCEAGGTTRPNELASQERHITHQSTGRARVGFASFRAPVLGNLWPHEIPFANTHRSRDRVCRR